MEERDQQVQTRDQQVATLNQAVTERDGQIANLNQSVSERDGQISILQGVIKNLEGEISVVQEQMAANEIELFKLADEMNLQISAYKEITQNFYAITSLHCKRWLELRGIYTSRIWRLMLPFREVITRLLCRPKISNFSDLMPDFLRALMGRSALITVPELDPLLSPENIDLAAKIKQNFSSESKIGLGFDRRDLWGLIKGEMHSSLGERGSAVQKEDCIESYAPKVKALAFILPQFHPIPENDLWWGKGFTEWRNVVNARPNFIGHYQPQLPADLGFYDLRIPETREEQASLARSYGINGFCYYYYWFGGRRLLHRPLDEVLSSGKPDFPYCICWANENWTRTWDGNSNEVLLGAEHSKEDSAEFIRSLIPHFKDSRYIRVGGAPMLLVYRVDIIPDMAKTVEFWRDECRLAGIPNLHVVAVQSFGISDPRPYGCDAAIEFPPHGTDMAWNCNDVFSSSILNPSFSGNIVDIKHAIEMSLSRPEPEYRLYRGIMPAWDNTARRQNNPLIFANSTPERYEYWLSELVRLTLAHQDHSERFIFINAWNEWAEGAHLEPDQRFGHRYLQATQLALAGNHRFGSLPAATQISEKTLETSVHRGAPNEIFVDSRERSPSIGRAIYLAGRWIFRRIPGSSQFKAPGINWLFSNTGSLFAQTPAYRTWASRRHISFSTENAVALTKKGPEDMVLDSKIVLRTSEKPRVSVVIPVFNNWNLTKKCLQSIARIDTYTNFEVLIVDDCSSDETKECLKSVNGVRVIHQTVNCGFLASCNNSVDECKGEYIIFLNNDTEVLDGWLDELVSLAEADSSVGMVGSMLIFPDGTLQEAGGIIFNDASGMNFGRGQHPHRPEFNYVREPDYCSGASILISKKTFENLGRFDTRYSPAYYEDTDLAFKVRESGLRVVFNPFSRVIHHEGATSGTDTSKGVKAYQLENQVKFLSRWRDVLQSHGGRDTNLTIARERVQNLRVLVIDVVTPLPDQDSGSVDTFSHLKVLLSLGFKVTFSPLSLEHHGKYTETLQRLGIECLYGPFVSSIEDYLKEEGGQFDLVIVKRIECAVVHIDCLLRYCKNARIIFDTVDLHFLREIRRANLEDSKELMRLALQTKKFELEVMSKSHATIVISDVEQAELTKERLDLNLHVIPFIRDVITNVMPFSERSDIVFVGGYLHAPNVDAVTYFCKEIWPIVCQELPGVRLRLIGSNMPDEVKSLSSIKGVFPEGFVSDLGDVFNHVRLSIAPLRFGAGIKGKVATSMCYGAPCVMSPLAAEGMGIEHGVSGMVSKSSQEFANSILSAYLDEQLWNSLSKGGIALMSETYSWARGIERWRRVISSVGISLDSNEANKSG